MKKLQKIIIFFILMLIGMAPLAGTSYSQTVTPTTTADIDQVKSALLAGFDQKIAELNLLPATIDADPQLTAEQKTLLKAKALQSIQLLTELKTKIMAAQTKEELLKILTDFMEQAQNPVNNDQLNTIQGIQDLLNTLKQQGVDITAMQAALDVLKKNIEQGPNAAEQVVLDFANVKSLGQAIQVLKKYYKQKPQKGQSNAAAAQQWTQILHQAQQLKKANPKLFPSYLPSLNPTRIPPTATIPVPTNTIAPTSQPTTIPTAIPTNTP